MKQKNPLPIHDQTLLSCWPDGFSRYYSVSRILKLVFENKSLDILDVGGDSEWMYKFLNDAGLTFSLKIVDTRPPDAVNKRVEYIRKDFFKLDRSFSSDAVVNTDVLEHIPADLKLPFIERCLEFAKSVAIFSAPQDDEDVTTAEKAINELITLSTGKQERWLKEHFEYGKPSAAKVQKLIEQKGYAYTVVDTNNLDNWLVTFATNLTNQHITGVAKMDELNRYYNSHINQVGDFTGKPYRKIFVVFKDATVADKIIPKIESFFYADNSEKTTLQSKYMLELVKAAYELQLAVRSESKKAVQLSRELDDQRAINQGMQAELDRIFSKRWFVAINKLLGN